MYHNIYIERNNNKPIVHLWDDKAGYQTFNYKPYAYIKYPTGTYRSLYDDKLKKINYWTEDDIKSNKLFESDVPIMTRVLIDQ